MRRASPLLVVLLGLWPASRSTPQPPAEPTHTVTLADGGRAALAAVVIPPEPAPGVEQAAAEVSYYVSAMAGTATPLPVRRMGAPEKDPPPAYVFVGRVDWALRLAAFDPSTLPAEGHAIFAHNASWLFVVGREDTANGTCSAIVHTDEACPNDSLHGAYALLDERMGVDWLWPGESGEVIPRRTRVAVTAPSASAVRPSAPQLLQRRMRPIYGHESLQMWRNAGHNAAQDGALSTWLNSSVFEALAADETRWLQRMRMGSHDVPPWGQAFMDWWQKYNTTHLEYFALQPDGHRGLAKRCGPEGVKMCVSNPALHRAIADGGTKHNQYGLSSAEDDGDVCYCTCDRCQSWDVPNATRWNEPGAGRGALSDRYARFFDSVHGALHDKSQWVTGYAVSSAAPFASISKAKRFSKRLPAV